MSRDATARNKHWQNVCDAVVVQHCLVFGRVKMGIWLLLGWKENPQPYLRTEHIGIKHNCVLKLKKCKISPSRIS